MPLPCNGRIGLVEDPIRAEPKAVSAEKSAILCDLGVFVEEAAGRSLRMTAVSASMGSGNARSGLACFKDRWGR